VSFIIFATCAVSVYSEVISIPSLIPAESSSNIVSPSSGVSCSKEIIAASIAEMI
jgi:hypothetical protein